MPLSAALATGPHWASWLPLRGHLVHCFFDPDVHGPCPQEAFRVVSGSGTGRSGTQGELTNVVEHWVHNANPVQDVLSLQHWHVLAGGVWLALGKSIRMIPASLNEARSPFGEVEGVGENTA